MNNQQVSPSKQVFTERKIDLDHAYQMAMDFMQQNQLNNYYDGWLERAFAWCLIDLIKREHKSGNLDAIKIYIEQLNQLNEEIFDSTNESNKILADNRDYVLKLANPLSKNIVYAKELSKQGDHLAALNEYYKIIKQQPNDIALQTSFAWELYHVSKSNLQQKILPIDKLKRYFFDYFKLSLPLNGMLHQCFLNIALRVYEHESNKGKFNFAVFAEMWNLENLKNEDFKPRTFETAEHEQKEIQPLALSVFRACLKSVLEQQNFKSLNVLFPYIQSNYKKIRGDIIWLKWDLIKTYLFINQYDKALGLCLELIKIKPKEYWLWDTIGDIYANQQNKPMAVNCYCKAITLQKDIGFSNKIKLKLTKYFVEQQMFSQAKCELDEIVQYKKNHEQKVSDELLSMLHSTWYPSAETIKSNKNFYQQYAQLAEEINHQHLPWISAELGEIYEYNEQIFRRIYLNDKKIPTEISVPEKKVAIANSNKSQAIKIKGEWNDKRKFQIYLMQERTDNIAIFSIYLAIVDNINTEKNITHFLIDETLNFSITNNELAKKSLKLELADAVEVELSQHKTKDGQIRYKAHKILKTETLPKNLIQLFNEEIEVSNGLGFGQSTDVFINPQMVRKFQIESGNQVSGLAIKAFNKKKNSWGWRAVKINMVG